MKNNYYPPTYKENKFHCPHCNVYAKQFWAHIHARTVYQNTFINSEANAFNEQLNSSWTISSCEHCNKKMFWLNDSTIYPKKIVVDQPNKDLSDEIKADYLEAAIIFNDSARSSAALLRLALQKLCIQLGEKGENLNDDIKSLVGKGLNPNIQKSLDLLRISGNNAVHPGGINIEENPSLVLKLFELINFIAAKMITEPKEISSFYEELPERAKKQIKKRDSKKK